MRTSREKYFGHLPVEENLYKVDFLILEKYQQYSAEILRITLLTMAIFGYLPKFIADIEGKEGQNLYNTFRNNEPLFNITVSLLLLSTFFCLAYRYFSSDNMTHHVRKLRLRNKLEIEEDTNKKEEIEQKIDVEIKSFENDLKVSKYTLMLSTLFFFLGVCSMFYTLKEIFFT